MARKPTGRVTPKRGGPAAAASKQRREVAPTKWELEESRQVRTPWGWRVMAFLSFVAVGVALIFFGNHDTTLGYLWLVIAVGWFAFAMLLWRKHSRYMRRR